MASERELALEAELADVRAERDALAAEVARLKEAPAQLHRLLDALQEQERMRDQFYSNMNHELRTPLSSIIGFAEDAIDGFAGDLTPQQQRYVRNILSSSTKLLDVITSLLDLSKLKGGKETAVPRPVALDEVVAGVEAMMSPLLQRKGQTLTLEIPPTAPRAYADPDKVQRILLNLLSNAHKFTPRGGRIAVRVAEAPDGVTLSVADDGPGIPEGELPYLFEEFTRVAKRSPIRPAGTGLGLAITQQLVALSGGQLEVESVVGRGSTFAVTLPVSAPVSAPPVSALTGGPPQP